MKQPNTQNATAFTSLRLDLFFEGDLRETQSAILNAHLACYDSVKPRFSLIHNFKVTISIFFHFNFFSTQ